MGRNARVIAAAFLIIIFSVCRETHAQGLRFFEVVDEAVVSGRTEGVSICDARSDGAQFVLQTRDVWYCDIDADPDPWDGIWKIHERGEIEVAPPDHAVQFADGTIFGGSSNFTFNDSTFEAAITDPSPTSTDFTQLGWDSTPFCLKGAAGTCLISMKPFAADDPFATMVRIGERGRTTGDAVSLLYVSDIWDLDVWGATYEHQGIYSIVEYHGNSTPTQMAINSLAFAKPGTGNTLGKVVGTISNAWYSDDEDPAGDVTFHWGLQGSCATSPRMDHGKSGTIGQCVGTRMTAKLRNSVSATNLYSGYGEAPSRVVVDNKQHSGADSTTVFSSTGWASAYVTDAWVGAVVYNLSDNGSSCTITAHDDDTGTCAVALAGGDDNTWQNNDYLAVVAATSVTNAITLRLDQPHDGSGAYPAVGSTLNAALALRNVDARQDGDVNVLFQNSAGSAQYFKWDEDDVDRPGESTFSFDQRMKIEGRLTIDTSGETLDIWRTGGGQPHIIFGDGTSDFGQIRAYTTGGFRFTDGALGDLLTLGNGATNDSLRQFNITSAGPTMTINRTGGGEPQILFEGDGTGLSQVRGLIGGGFEITDLNGNVWTEWITSGQSRFHKVANFGTSSTNQTAIQTSGVILRTCASGLGNAYRGEVDGDAEDRIRVTCDAELEFGDGTNPVDTVLKRIAASHLGTDSGDDFTVGGDLEVTGNADIGDGTLDSNSFDFDWSSETCTLDRDTVGGIGGYTGGIESSCRVTAPVDEQAFTIGNNSNFTTTPGCYFFDEVTADAGVCYLDKKVLLYTEGTLPADEALNHFFDIQTDRFIGGKNSEWWADNGGAIGFHNGVSMGYGCVGQMKIDTTGACGDTGNDRPYWDKNCNEICDGTEAYIDAATGSSPAPPAPGPAPLVYVTTLPSPIPNFPQFAHLDRQSSSKRDLMHHTGRDEGGTWRWFPLNEFDRIEIQPDSTSLSGVDFNNYQFVIDNALSETTTAALIGLSSTFSFFNGQEESWGIALTNFGPLLGGGALFDSTDSLEFRFATDTPRYQRIVMKNDGLYLRADDDTKLFVSNEAGTTDFLEIDSTAFQSWTDVLLGDGATPIDQDTYGTAIFRDLVTMRNATGTNPVLKFNTGTDTCAQALANGKLEFANTCAVSPTFGGYVGPIGGGTAGVQTKGLVRPETDSTDDLGTDTVRYRDAYFDSVKEGDKIQQTEFLLKEPLVKSGSVTQDDPTPGALDPPMYTFPDGVDSCITGSTMVPTEFYTQPYFIMRWTANSTTTNAVKWDVSYRSSIGYWSVSVEESKTATDAHIGSAWSNNNLSFPMTAGNFTGRDTMVWELCRDGDDVADTLAADAHVGHLFFQYDED